MASVKTELKGTTLVVTIDVSKGAIENAKPSASGKTRLVATTGGGLPVQCGGVDMKLALNLYTSN